MFHRLAFDRGAGLPLLLLHGIGVGPELFVDLVDVLARTRRVLVPWLPGYGESPPLLDDRSFARATELLVRDVAILAPEGLDVFGYSGGGYRAVRLLVEAPALVRDVFLLAGFARLEPEGMASFGAAADAVAGGADLAAPLAQGAVGPRYLTECGGDVKQIESLVRAVPTATFASELRALANLEDMLPRLPPRGQHRVTLRVGELDATAAPARSEELAARLPTAIVERVPEAGHVLLLEDRERTMASISRAFAR